MHAKMALLTNTSDRVAGSPTSLMVPPQYSMASWSQSGR